MNKELTYGQISKKILHDTFKEDFKDASQVFITSFAKMSSSSINTLRKELRVVNIRYRVVKNRVARKALTGTSLESLAEHIKGSCGIAISSGDVTTASKVFQKFAAENEAFQVITLNLNGQYYDRKQIERLATLPSREELIGKVCGGLKSPLFNLVGVLSALPRNLVSVINQIKEKKEKQ